MGVGTSKEEEARLAATVHKLSKVELKYIEKVFGDLSYTSENGKRLIKRPTWLNRENFASKFGLPDFLGEQLFAAFDRDQNEVIDLDEFLIGMALCLHGSVKDKCQFLFKLFNLNDDEGITKDELSTVLINVLQSTHGLLKRLTSTDQEEGTVGWDMKINETVEKIVRDAFDKCDTSRNGKLEINEFEHWLHKNPKLFDSVFMISCPKSTAEPENYEVIATPISSTQPAAFGDAAGTSQGSTTRLSDLFSGDVTTTKDIDGQSFFDSISTRKQTEADSSALPPFAIITAEDENDSEEFGEPSGGEMIRDLTVGENNREEIGDPTVPELAKDIISHRKIHLTEEPIVSRGSQMSLVSLGQSTGDLSSLDGEAAVADQGVQVTVGQQEPVQSVADIDELSSGLPDEQGDKSPTVKEPSTSPDETEALSWHPLQETNASLVTEKPDDEENEPIFQDASDVVVHETSTETKPNLLTEPIEVNISLDNDLVDNELTSGTTLTNDVLSEETIVTENLTLDPTKDHKEEISGFVETQKINTVSELKSDKTTHYERPDSDGSTPGFKEVLATDDTFFPERPATLNVPSDKGLSSVDLSPSEHAIGKPTLRQLAEMKEFDTSPSLEDNKSVLSEARLAAWQPSVETSHLIEATRRGNVIDKTHLTYPSVLLETSMGDPVKDLVAKFLGEQEAAKRPVPTADSVTMNDAGLRDLLEAQCWRGAVDWTAKYLTAHGQGLSSGSPTGPFNHTPKLLQIWFVRIALLFKLKSFSSAEAELNAFGDFDNPDLYYDYYPDLYPGMQGSLVPFSLRIIHAELPQHNGRPQETLDRLYRLLSIIDDVLNNLKNGLSEQGEEISLNETDRSGAIELWSSRHTRILFSIGNCLLGNKEYSLALKIFSEIIKKKPETKSAIISGVGRLHLQLGDINLAKKYFKKVEQISLGDPKTLSITVMNRGFVALAEGKYDEAYENFQSVTKLNPENSSAWNNSAVCLLFLGKVKEASTLLETLIWKSPKRNLHEDIIFNLCTIYELETSRAFQKKQKLLDLVSRHKGDGFNIQSLKLT